MPPSDQNDKEGTPPARGPSAFQLWFEEAWEGWLQTVGLMALMAGAYAGYKFDLLPEAFAGLALVLAIVFGSLVAAVLPAWPLVRTPGGRSLFVTFVAVWAVAVGYPSLRGARPPRSLAEVKLSTAQPSATAHVDKTGPLEVTVSGRFKKTSAAELDANYALKVAASGSTDEVEGSLERKQVSLRTSRRGGRSTTITEKTETLHRLPTVRGGGDLTFSGDSIDDKDLEDGLTVSIRPAGLNPLLFMALGALAFLIAIGFDVRLADPKSKTKTYLAAACGLTVVFSIYFPEAATPHALVGPAVGEAFRGLFVGGGMGYLLSLTARLLVAPKSVKKSRR